MFATLLVGASPASAPQRQTLGGCLLPLLGLASTWHLRHKVFWMTASSDNDHDPHPHIPDGDGDSDAGLASTKTIEAEGKLLNFTIQTALNESLHRQEEATKESLRRQQEMFSSLITKQDEFSTSKTSFPRMCPNSPMMCLNSPRTCPPLSRTTAR
eukprot:TRINITY_DN19083_c0_g1_i1.p1 TRINITY_DN19083_c0_g1~~TRINITY_DN19083_c0_g1_i1.p1  ORF type:complete len:156 (+),score=10.25 TRINITY_DN19083_c0_g1_i1:373-840(+)